MTESHKDSDDTIVPISAHVFMGHDIFGLNNYILFLIQLRESDIFTIPMTHERSPEGPTIIILHAVL